MAAFCGIDHIDSRVRSLAEAEPFYDKLMPALGWPVKSFAYVAPDGEWHEPDDAHPYNAFEYHQRADGVKRQAFFGFIEERDMEPTRARIAFALPTRADVEAWETRLHEFGARNIERSEDMEGYPAIFFEDPCGNRLEVCARKVRPAE